MLTVAEPKVLGEATLTAVTVTVFVVGMLAGGRIYAPGGDCAHGPVAARDAVYLPRNRAAGQVSHGGREAVCAPQPHLCAAAYRYGWL